MGLSLAQTTDMIVYALEHRQIQAPPRCVWPKTHRKCNQEGRGFITIAC